jgi:uncharacterized membrane protein YcaP (DUF421 family)
MEIVLRATVVFWFLWLIVRGTGKRSLSELTPLDLLLVVVVGDLVQQGVTQEDMSVTGAILAASVFVGWTLVADAVERRSPKARRVLSGEPLILLRAGEPLEERLEEERITVDELKEAARLEGYRDLTQLDYAVLETDGKFSFIPVDDRQADTPKAAG